MELMMIEYMIDIDENQKLIENIMDWDTLGYVVKPEVISWLDSNTDGALFRGVRRCVGTNSFTRLVFIFNSEADIMAFKLTWN